MRILKKSIGYITLLIMFGCSDEENYIKQTDGTFMAVTKTNDSIIKRVVQTSNRQLYSIEYENTNTNFVKVYYYDENEELYQSLHFNTVKQDFFDNYIYYDNGKVAEKVVKNANGEEVSSFEYDKKGNLIRKSFYRVGYPVKIAFVSYTEKGDVDFSYRNSHFFRLQKNGHWLYLKPVGTENKVFNDAFMNLVDEFEDDENMLDKQFIFESDSILKIDLRQFIDQKSLKCKIHIRESDVNGYPCYDRFELYIENLDSIPKNNLYPIL